MADRVLVGDYSFNKMNKIGDGYSSTVYLGKNDMDNSKVAIKCISIRDNMDSVGRQLLQNQVQVLKKVQHSNILHCYDVIKTTQYCYIITQYCQGGDLETLMKREGVIDITLAKNILKDIFMGLSQLHRHRILHRDLKPANIFISGGIYKIADLGFAKVDIYPGKKQRYNVGSPLYMSPQSLENNIYSIKNDIWSLGIMAYEMVYAKTPWSCRSERELIQKMKTTVAFPFHSQMTSQYKEFIRNVLQVDEPIRPGIQQLSQLPLFSQLQETKPLGQKNIFQDKVINKGLNFNVDRISSKNKQNYNRKQSNDIFKVIEKINEFRLIFKLIQQLRSNSQAAPHLRIQLIQGISQIRKQDMSQKVRSVVQEYYLKYRRALQGKQIYVVDGVMVKLINEFKDMEQWGKELTLAFILFKNGNREGLAQVLEKPLYKTQGDMLNKLRTLGFNI